MTRVLLTGKTGFLGNIIYNHLKVNPQITLTTIGRRDSDIFFDYKKSENFDKYDIVIHAAGLAHVFKKPIIIQNNFDEFNCIGLSNLLNSFNSFNKPKYFVYISSVSVYGLITGHNISEETPLLASDPYGISKIKAEKLIQNWCYENNIIYTILRLPLVIGENAPGNLKKMILGIRNGYYFNIAGGKSLKSVVLASDVAKFIIDAAFVGGIYNLTDRYHPSICELSREISAYYKRTRILNISYRISLILALLGDLFPSFPFNTNTFYKMTSTLTFNDSKAVSNFGWNPQAVIKNFKFYN